MSKVKDAPSTANQTSEDASASTSGTITGAADQQQQPNQQPQQPQVQLRIDDSATPAEYAKTVRVWGSAEEINLDFAQAPRPSGPNQATLTIDRRMTISPWAAKRLAIALGQSITRYEQTYGPLVLDEKQRRKA